MILWCEMEDEQRRIWRCHRNDFRDKIPGTIQSRGIQRSQLTILRGSDETAADLRLTGHPERGREV